MKITEAKLRQIIREEIELQESSETSYRGLPKRASALGPGGKAAVSAVIRRLRREHPDSTFKRNDTAGTVTVGGRVTVNVVGRTYDELEMVLRDAVDRAGTPT